MDNSESKRKQNEKFFQSINEDIKQSIKDNLGTVAQSLINGHFVCECSDMECSEIIDITPKAYEPIANKDNLYIVIPGHEQPDIEEVVDDTSKNYWVVKKH